jgi:hypothetical protein
VKTAGASSASSTKVTRSRARPNRCNASATRFRSAEESSATNNSSINADGEALKP